MHDRRCEAWFDFEVGDAVQPLGQKRVHFKASQVHAQASMHAAAECPVALAPDLSVAAPRYLIAAVCSARGFQGQPHRTERGDCDTTDLDFSRGYPRDARPWRLQAEDFLDERGDLCWVLAQLGPQ